MAGLRGLLSWTAGSGDHPLSLSETGALREGGGLWHGERGILFYSPARGILEGGQRRDVPVGAVRYRGLRIDFTPRRFGWLETVVNGTR